MFIIMLSAFCFKEKNILNSSRITLITRNWVRKDGSLWYQIYQGAINSKVEKKNLSLKLKQSLTCNNIKHYGNYTKI